MNEDEEQTLVIVSFTVAAVIGFIIILLEANNIDSPFISFGVKLTSPDSISIARILFGLMPALIALSKGQCKSGTFFGWWCFGVVFFVPSLLISIFYRVDSRVLFRQRATQ
jgi:hypothetical protein